jgi:hypothetical protein
MAKAPQTSDHFKLIINRLSPEQLGVVIADLAKREIFDIRPELITDVVTFKNKGQNGASTELITAWSVDHPTFQAVEVCRHFESLGLSRGAAYPALGVLVEKGVLVKSAPGHYRRADVKQLEPPKPARKMRDEKPHKTFDKRGEDVILTHARRNHGRFNTQKLIEMFTTEGRARNSVYASIDGLLKKKMVKRVGDAGSGQYVLLTKAVTAKKKAAKKPVTKKANGAMPVVTEVADHG